MPEFAIPDVLITVFYFFAALFPLVLIHELGHFSIAKLNGIRCDEFGIGFPPRLFRLFKIAETEYTINALPLGGFVRLAGENDPDVPGAFAAAGKAARAAVLFAGPVFNFALAAVLLAGIAWMSGAPETVAGADVVHVVQVIEDTPAERSGMVSGDLVVGIGGQPLNRIADEMQIEGTDEQPAGMTALMRTTDEMTGRPMQLDVVRGVERTVETSMIGEGLEFGTERLGGLAVLRVRSVDVDVVRHEIVPGDVIIGPETFVASEGSTEEPVLATVMRGEDIREVSLEVVPEDGRIGVSIAPLSAMRRMGVADASVYGVQRTVGVMGAMVGLLGGMVTGSQDAEIAGPVGIARIGRQVGERGLSDFTAFMALLSINLGIINLVPIPGLDGGRLVFVGLEALRGRRLEPSREEVVHFIGIALVIGLMLVITAYEIFGAGFVDLP